MFDPKVLYQDRTPPSPRDAPRPVTSRPFFRPVRTVPHRQFRRGLADELRMGSLASGVGPPLTAAELEHFTRIAWKG